jgi:hypothetical protein
MVASTAMRAVLAIAVVGLAGCFTNALSNANKSKQIQREALEDALPATLEVPEPLPGTGRTARVRVWAAEDYRTQHVRWRAQIEEELDDVNQFLVPAVGIKLEAEAIEPWEVSTADRGLAELLTELATHDPGDDVDWVIGYGSGLSLVEGSFDQLGMARPLGRHLMVRGYSVGSERDQFARAYPSTSAADRDRVLAARRRHKQATVLIHELAHTLGVPHEREPTWLMATSYATTMSTLSKQSRAVMQLALETWLTPRASFDLASLAARLTSYFESNPWGGWEPDDHGQLVAELRAVVSSGRGASPSGLTGPAREQYEHAVRLAASGKPAEALAELEALVAAYPATPDVRLAICQGRIALDGPTAATASKACDRALEVAPDDPRPHLALAQALAGRGGPGDRAAALGRLTAVEAMAGGRAEVWAALVELYQAQQLVTLTERALDRLAAAKPGADADGRAWLLRIRGRYGLPPDGTRWKIAVTDEPDYVAAVRELLDLIYADKFADAKAKAKAAEKRWPGAPGVLAARCDLALRQQQAAAARALCDQAIAAWSGAAWALYLRGVLLVGSGKTAPAIASLRAAIAAEPSLAQAYRTLAKALDRAGDRAGREALAIEYQARFGARLP